MDNLGPELLGVARLAEHVALDTIHTMPLQGHADAFQGHARVTRTRFIHTVSLQAYADAFQSSEDPSSVERTWNICQGKILAWASR